MPLLAKPADQSQNKIEKTVKDNESCDGKIERNPLAGDGDIARKVTDPRKSTRSPNKDGTDGGEHSTAENEISSDGLGGVHGGLFSP